MNDEPNICGFCCGTLTVVPTQDHPELDDLICRNVDCEEGWVSQAARHNGPGSLQVEFAGTGINRFRHGKPSQGEDNCQPVANGMLAWLGEGFSIAKPCPKSGAKRDSLNEQGFDFLLKEPCEHKNEIQVTRIPESRHFADVAAANRRNEPLVDARPHSTLIALIEAAIQKKTAVTPEKDRAARILAIDGLCPSVGLNFFLTGIRFTNTKEVFGWRGVVLVCSELNMLFFGGDGWPHCPKCEPSRINPPSRNEAFTLQATNDSASIDLSSTNVRASRPACGPQRSMRSSRSRYSNGHGWA